MTSVTPNKPIKNRPPPELASLLTAAATMFFDPDSFLCASESQKKPLRVPKRAARPKKPIRPIQWTMNASHFRALGSLVFKSLMNVPLTALTICVKKAIRKATPKSAMPAFPIPDPAHEAGNVLLDADACCSSSV